jgi:hypothetical protein
VERSGDNLKPPGDSVVFHIPPNPFEFYNLEDEQIALSFATAQHYDYPDDLSDPHIEEVVDLAPILAELGFAKQALSPLDCQVIWYIWSTYFRDHQDRALLAQALDCWFTSREGCPSPREELASKQYVWWPSSRDNLLHPLPCGHPEQIIYHHQVEEIINNPRYLHLLRSFTAFSYHPDYPGNAALVGTMEDFILPSEVQQQFTQRLNLQERRDYLKLLNDLKAATTVVLALIPEGGRDPERVGTDRQGRRYRVNNDTAYVAPYQIVIDRSKPDTPICFLRHTPQDQIQRDWINVTTRGSAIPGRVVSRVADNVNSPFSPARRSILGARSEGKSRVTLDPDTPDSSGPSTPSPAKAMQEQGDLAL